MFDLYLKTQLVPTLRPGDVVILDNLSSHKSSGVAKALSDIGAWFLFLPPYSPDLLHADGDKSDRGRGPNPQL